ncbi:unnamed protein product, partial [Staurois parvus]
MGPPTDPGPSGSAEFPNGQSTPAYIYCAISKLKSHLKSLMNVNVSVLTCAIFCSAVSKIVLALLFLQFNVIS